MHPLKIYCLKNKISQKKLAKELNKSENWISFIISCKKKPSPKLAKKISQLTGIPVLQLLYPEDYKDLDIKNYQRHNHNQGVA